MSGVGPWAAGEGEPRGSCVAWLQPHLRRLWSADRWGSNDCGHREVTRDHRGSSSEGENKQSTLVLNTLSSTSAAGGGYGAALLWCLFSSLF